MRNIEFLDANWGEVFTALLEPPTIKLRDAPTAGLENDSIGVLTLYNISLHWVIKNEWQKKYRIPYPSKVVKVMEPFGRVLTQYLRLCTCCHSWLGSPNPYSTAATWFWYIVRESQRNTIFNSANIGKSESLRVRREIIDSIINKSNPISKDLAIHEWRLIERVRSFPPGSEMYENYLCPFIREYRAWINDTKGPDWGAKLVENDKLFIRNGQGKGKILLDFKTALNQSKFLN